ncbi:hypothetical protein ACJIZ3_022863 [Penstemon smallii]|uniref:Transmembrane protein n=1 Tax=Penstemon smallii TaxID=265156 RepID=A0ABD3TNC3_9LAMI
MIKRHPPRHFLPLLLLYPCAFFMLSLQFSGPRKNSFLICPSHTFSSALEMRPPCAFADLPWRVFVNLIRYLVTFALSVLFFSYGLFSDILSFRREVVNVKKADPVLPFRLKLGRDWQ